MSILEVKLLRIYLNKKVLRDLSSDPRVNSNIICKSCLRNLVMSSLFGDFLNLIKKRQTIYNLNLRDPVTDLI